jgi:hypothetical protein
MGERKHNHYFKSVAGLQDVDVYRVLLLFGVTDPCLQHAIKKLLVAGGRGGGKDISRDVQEAADTLARWQEMRREETGRTLEPAVSDCALRGTSMQKEHAKSCGFCLAAEKQGPLMGATEGPTSVRIPANEGYKAKC